MSKSENNFYPKTIKDILKDIVSQKSLKKGVENVRICNAWGEVMGENIIQYTGDIHFAYNNLYVSLSSAPLKMELTYKLETIVKRLNSHLGSVVIKKIILR
jgi:hypothetical protein